MVSPFARHRRLPQWIAALVLLTGWLVPLAVPHAADDDWACVFARGLDDETAALLGAASLDQPDHCIVCHSARSFRSAFAHSGRVELRLAPGLVADVRVDRARRNAAFDRLPARAPPAASFPASSYC